MIRFTRTSFFFTGVALIFLIYVVYKLSVIAMCERTNGLVVTHESTMQKNYRRYSTYPFYAMVVYEAEGREWLMRGSENVTFREGDVVPVLYRRSDPGKAYVYTFWSFWFRPILVLPLIALGAITIGIGRDGSYWTFYLKPMRLVRTELQKRRDL